jgi:5-(carboxyamino)imidazole ribonucleotide mutase
MQFVSILMGSKSDYEVMKKCSDTLDKFEIPYELIITSAHRSPDRTKSYVKEAEEKGAGVFICAAGLAAHLAGVVASLTLKPIIGVPMKGGVMDGLDALLSTVQMPGGMPVATVAVGNAGAVNSAYLAMQILAQNDNSIYDKLRLDRETRIQGLEKDSESIGRIL